MNKSYFVSLVVLLFFCMHVQGQEKSIFSVYYTLQENGHDTINWYRYMLDIGETTSYYHDLYEYENRMLDDSICRSKGITPNPNSYSAHMLLSPERKRFHPHYSRFHVLKNLNSGSITVADEVRFQGSQKFFYQESTPEYGWEMLDGDTIIGGYACQKARMNYRGHKWTAWYAPEIAVSDGPWKLCGLPGLILEAMDAEGDFRFVFDALENHTNRDVAFSSKGWKKTTAEKLYKMYLQKQKSEMAGLARAVDGMPTGGKMNVPPYHYLERFEK